MARLATPFLRALPRPGAGRSWIGALLFVGTLIVSGCSTVTAPPPAAQAPAAAVAPVVPQTVKVALLLPLSGQSASIGQPMLEAAQLALFDTADTRFELLPRDTGGTPQGAAQAAREALADGARLVLGPLFAAEVAAVKPVVQGRGVPMLAFSNDRTLAGGGTHILGFVPADQVERVVGYGRSQGITRFAALVPRTAYGTLVVDALQSATQRYGAQLTQIERYDPAAADRSVAAQPFAGLPAPPQALMLAEGGEPVKRTAAALAAAGVDPRTVRLLGTGLWDDAGLGQEPALVGAWFAAPAPDTRAAFEARFERTYGQKPPRIATIAYDATALAAALTALRGTDPFAPANLARASGFDGADGLFRLRASGIAQRGLAVLEVTPAGARVIDPAPGSFDLLGQ